MALARIARSVAFARNVLPRVQTSSRMSNSTKNAFLAKAGASVISTSISGKAVRPDNVDIVIYHADCTDGFASAFSAWMRLGDKPQYVPLQHGPGLCPPDVKDKNVVVLDFSFNEQVTRELITQAAGYLVLDHHASAQSALAGVADANKTFEMGQSGATLAWNYFHPTQEVPLLMRYVEDRDIWRWAYVESEAFSAGLGLVKKDFAVWKALLEGGDAAIQAVIKDGRALVAYQNKVRDWHVKRARACSLKVAPQHTGLVVNGSTLASDIGNAMCQVRFPPAAEGVPGRLAEFGMIWEYDHGAHSFRVSLRSDSDAVDVSAMAKAHGGGGHRRAAGFTYVGAHIEDILMAPQDVPAEWKPEPAGQDVAQ